MWAISQLRRDQILTPAKTQRSYFQEGTELYEGQPGTEFGGELRHIGTGDTIFFSLLEILFMTCSLTAPPRHQVSTAAAPKSAWRQIAPFLLIVGVVLLLLLKYFSSFSSIPPPVSRECINGFVFYEVAAGDSCWSIAEGHGWDLESLNRVNPHLNCNPLLPGNILCVPHISWEISYPFAWFLSQWPPNC